MSDDAVPGLQAGDRSPPAQLTLDVDGELFAVRPGPGGGTDYTWLSGPNDGYGFATSETLDRSDASHRETIRAFLTMIDPDTGYIGDD